MRSYKYDNGTWTVINDPLPVAGQLDTQVKVFEKALSSYGFSRFYTTTLLCVAGKMTVHARNHEKLNATRQANDFPYDFFCTFTLNGSDIRVWTVDFPSLLRFLSEIEAHPETRNEPENPLSSLIGDSDFQHLLFMLPSVLSKLSQGDIEITVKPPTSQKKM